MKIVAIVVMLLISTSCGIKVKSNLINKITSKSSDNQSVDKIYSTGSIYFLPTAQIDKVVNASLVLSGMGEISNELILNKETINFLSRKIQKYEEEYYLNEKRNSINTFEFKDELNEVSLNISPLDLISLDQLYKKYKKGQMPSVQMNISLLINLKNLEQVKNISRLRFTVGSLGSSLSESFEANLTDCDGGMLVIDNNYSLNTISSKLCNLKINIKNSEAAINSLINNEQLSIRVEDFDFELNNGEIKNYKEQLLQAKTHTAKLIISTSSRLSLFYIDSGLSIKDALDKLKVSYDVSSRGDLKKVQFEDSTVIESQMSIKNPWNLFGDCLGVDQQMRPGEVCVIDNVVLEKFKYNSKKFTTFHYDDFIKRVVDLGDLSGGDRVDIKLSTLKIRNPEQGTKEGSYIINGASCTGKYYYVSSATQYTEIDFKELLTQIRLTADSGISVPLSMLRPILRNDRITFYIFPTNNNLYRNVKLQFQNFQNIKYQMKSGYDVVGCSLEQSQQVKTIEVINELTGGFDMDVYQLVI